METPGAAGQCLLGGRDLVRCDSAAGRRPVDLELGADFRRAAIRRIHVAESSNVFGATDRDAEIGNRDHAALVPIRRERQPSYNDPTFDQEVRPRRVARRSFPICAQKRPAVHRVMEIADSLAFDHGNVAEDGNRRPSSGRSSTSSPSRAQFWQRIPDSRSWMSADTCTRSRCRGNCSRHTPQTEKKAPLSHFARRNGVILGIETSCDETAAALVTDDGEIVIQRGRLPGRAARALRRRRARGGEPAAPRADRAGDRRGARRQRDRRGRRHDASRA